MQHRARPRGADQPDSASSTARTTSTPICRPAIRSRNTRSRSSARARSCSTCPTARRAQVGITRLHLEQDAGKSLHDQHPTQTYVDLNRAGVGADGDRLRARPAERRGGRDLSAQAALDPALSRHLRRQHGGGLAALRLNVSVRQPGEPLGTRCEIKNVNSVRFVMQAIEYEARRQVEVDRGRRHGRAGDAALRCRRAA